MKPARLPLVRHKATPGVTMPEMHERPPSPVTATPPDMQTQPVILFPVASNPPRQTSRFQQGIFASD